MNCIKKNVRVVLNMKRKGRAEPAAAGLVKDPMFLEKSLTCRPSNVGRNWGILMPPHG